MPPFQMAFEKEIGKFPSKEQMKIMVSRNKARPLFPQVWKNSNPAIQQLKVKLKKLIITVFFKHVFLFSQMTIMESWDDDGEARLTACCIGTYGIFFFKYSRYTPATNTRVAI